LTSLVGTSPGSPEHVADTSYISVSRSNGAIGAIVLATRPLGPANWNTVQGLPWPARVRSLRWWAGRGLRSEGGSHTGACSRVFVRRCPRQGTPSRHDILKALDPFPSTGMVACRRAADQIPPWQEWFGGI